MTRSPRERTCRALSAFRATLRVLIDELAWQILPLNKEWYVKLAVYPAVSVGDIQSLTAGELLTKLGLRNRNKLDGGRILFRKETNGQAAFLITGSPFMPL